ncbi:HET-domain-containing protein [Pyrenochaeta sp. DS3sAY3a]|nr:HET-domain-containing protein [Pyrenochaeta sp. DS3sAY3a]
MNGKEGFQSGEDQEMADTSFLEIIHSCSFCNVQELDPGMEPKRTAGDLSSGTLIRYRGSRVRDGASEGCTFFKDAFDSLESILKTHEHEQGSDSPHFRPENWIYELFFSGHTGRLETASGVWRCVMGELRGDTRQPKQRASSYFVLACQGNPAAESIPIRPFLHDFRGQRSTLWAKQHLWECENNHQNCTLPSSPFLPTRLLKIDTSSEEGGMCVRIYLITSSELDIARTKYATLSYCWGGPQEFQLNAGSEDMLKGGISVSILPKTLRDAVQVTWDLGIRWIWIDSLCIRQDRPEDKTTEVAQMHMIYAGSFITISASRAGRCSQGFLHQCSLPALGTIGYRLPFASPSGRLGFVILSRGQMNSPIDYRGWTLQEHLLARRVLRFTDYQLHWSCGVISVHENDTVGSLPSSHVRLLDRAYKMYKGIRAKDRNCRNWMDIVEQYACRQLSDELDKLPAISGIAQAWAQTSNDNYLAGLWKSHLPLGLLWSCAQPFKQGKFQTYRAPSWSWASLVGQVDWFNANFTEVDPMLEVVSCVTNPAHPQAPYGAVQSGLLTVQGLVQQTVFNGAPELPASTNEDNEYLDLDLADVHLDFWDEILVSKVEGSRIFSLQICCFDESTGNGPSGLLLATKDGKEFSRIGMFFFEPPQRHDVEELNDFQALFELSEARKFVQRSAFQGSVPQTQPIRASRIPDHDSVSLNRASRDVGTDINGAVV